MTPVCPAIVCAVISMTTRQGCLRGHMANCELVTDDSLQRLMPPRFAYSTAPDNHLHIVVGEVVLTAVESENTGVNGRATSLVPLSVGLFTDIQSALASVNANHCVMQRLTKPVLAIPLTFALRCISTKSLCRLSLFTMRVESLDTVHIALLSSLHTCERARP